MKQKKRNLIVLADAKRGDIGSSTTAYARAWLSGEPHTFGADAMTANAYLGFGSLLPLCEEAKKQGNAVFVVVHSSNSEGRTLQSAITANGAEVAERLAHEISTVNTSVSDNSIGAVIGATLGRSARATIETLSNALFLVPGLGVQGANVDDIAHLFGAASNRVIASSSRGIAMQGPDPVNLRNAVTALATELRKLHV